MGEKGKEQPVDNTNVRLLVFISFVLFVFCFVLFSVTPPFNGSAQFSTTSTLPPIFMSVQSCIGFHYVYSAVFNFQMSFSLQTESFLIWKHKIPLILILKYLKNTLSWLSVFFGVNGRMSYVFPYSCGEEALYTCITYISIRETGRNFLLKNEIPQNHVVLINNWISCYLFIRIN